MSDSVTSYSPMARQIIREIQPNTGWVTKRRFLNEGSRETALCAGCHQMKPVWGYVMDNPFGTAHCSTCGSLYMRSFWPWMETRASGPMNPRICLDTDEVHRPALPDMNDRRRGVRPAQGGDDD